MHTRAGSAWYLRSRGCSQGAPQKASSGSGGSSWNRSVATVPGIAPGMRGGQPPRSTCPTRELGSSRSSPQDGSGRTQQGRCGQRSAAAHTMKLWELPRVGWWGEVKTKRNRTPGWRGWHEVKKGDLGGRARAAVGRSQPGDQAVGGWLWHCPRCTCAGGDLSFGAQEAEPAPEGPGWQGARGSK